jgi:REP element-mobilizing transposase RayT
MRPLRFLPSGHLVEVTSRTVHGRLLMRPDQRTCDLIRGVLGRAQARYRMRIVAFVFLSNHFHLLLLPDSPQQLSSFMAYLASNVAREVGRVHDWRDKFWARRYRAITVSNEETAQVARLRYLLAHGAKEGFVAAPREWPGPHSIPALFEGATIQGTWFDRSSEYRARRKGVECSPRDFASIESVTLTPIPCWASWPEDRRRKAVGDLLAAIERDAQIVRAGKPPLGREAILRQSPHQPPARIKRSLSPAFHVATKAAWQLLREAYRSFVNAFRRASELLRSGDRAVAFPEGSFPPALPYVPVESG